MKKFTVKGFSLIELLISMGLLSGVMVVSSIMFKSHQSAQVTLNRKTEANTIYGYLGKLFTQQDVCDQIFLNESNGSDVAGKLVPRIPTDLKEFLTIDNALIANLAPDTTAPFQLDVQLSYLDMDQVARKDIYRFFIEAHTDASGKILYCHTIFAAFLSTMCDLIGGELIARDQNGDGVVQELSCKLHSCDNNPLSDLYAPPNTSPTDLHLDASIYQDHHASSRYCFVSYLNFFLTAVSANNYVLQTTDDSMSGTLQGASGEPIPPTFTTQQQLQAQRWCIGGPGSTDCRTILDTACPAGQYARGITGPGAVDCAPNPLPAVCIPICPHPDELCEDFVYDGYDGCGARCNITGTRPPACRNNDPDPDPSRCVGETRTVPNGCSDQTCTLHGTKTPSCHSGDTDSTLCSGSTRTESDGCGNTCVIIGTQNCATSTPTPTPSPTTAVGASPTPTPTLGAGSPSPTPTTGAPTCNASSILCSNTKCAVTCSGSGGTHTLFSGERGFCYDAGSGSLTSNEASTVASGYGTSARFNAAYSFPAGFVKASAPINHRLECSACSNWGDIEFGSRSCSSLPGNGSNGCFYINSSTGSSTDFLSNGNANPIGPFTSISIQGAARWFPGFATHHGLPHNRGPVTVSFSQNPSSAQSCTLTIEVP